MIARYWDVDTGEYLRYFHSGAFNGDIISYRCIDGGQDTTSGIHKPRYLEIIDRWAADSIRLPAIDDWKHEVYLELDLELSTENTT